MLIIYRKKDFIWGDTMRIKRTSVITGIERTRNIAIEPEDWAQYQLGYVSIDDAMPYLTNSDREFILSGIIESEWEEIKKHIEV